MVVVQGRFERLSKEPDVVRICAVDICDQGFGTGLCLRQPLVITEFVLV